MDDIKRTAAAAVPPVGAARPKSLCPPGAVGEAAIEDTLSELMLLPSSPDVGYAAFRAETSARADASPFGHLQGAPDSGSQHQRRDTEPPPSVSLEKGKLFRFGSAKVVPIVSDGTFPGGLGGIVGPHGSPSGQIQVAGAEGGPWVMECEEVEEQEEQEEQADLLIGENGQQKKSLNLDPSAASRELSPSAASRVLSPSAASRELSPRIDEAGICCFTGLRRRRKCRRPEVIQSLGSYCIRPRRPWGG